MRARLLVAGWMGIACCLHLIIVASILRQPLGVADHPEERSITWPLCNDSVHRPGPFADFFGVYQAGRAIRGGADPYAFQIQPDGVPYHFAFRYPPAVALVSGALLGNLTPRVAAILWAAVQEILLAWILLLFWRRARGRQARLLGASVLLLSVPYFLEVHMGQFTFVAMALSAASLLLLDPQSTPKRNQFAAAACASAAVFLKVFPLVLAPAWWRRGRAGRICLVVAVGILAVANGPYFLSHTLHWREFIEGNFGRSSLAGALDSGNHGTLYFLYTLFHHGIGRRMSEGWLSFVQVWRVAVLVPAGLLVLLARRRDLLLSGAVMGFAHFLSYQHVWEHHMSAVIVLGLLVLIRAEGSQKEGHGNTGGSISLAGAPRKPTAEFRLLAAALIVLALPTPFVLFDRGLPPALPDPSIRWPWIVRLALPAFKVLPVWLLTGLAVRRLLADGLVGLRIRRDEASG